MRVEAFVLALISVAVPAALRSQQLTPYHLGLPKGKQISLSLPAGLAIDVAATGLHCPRFFAMSPDGRIFVADLYNRSDNSRGGLYILEDWDAQAHRFMKVTPYLEHLHNPNNVAFYSEPAQPGRASQTWLYTALTDRLIRFRYQAGDHHPTSAPETLATFPAYGLSYKYGGWHLTRTVALGQTHGAIRLFVTVGSSCNACKEKEPIRASLTVMDPDGKNQHLVAAGLRNAVDLRYISQVDGGALFATNMGADHLGEHSPEDTFFELDSNAHNGPAGDPAHPANYGWPTCYFLNGAAHPDPKISGPQRGQQVPNSHSGSPPTQFDCSKVPPAYTTFPAHSSPLGLEYFGEDNRVLANSFLVALHGASLTHIGTGYRVVSFSPGERRPRDFVLGFLTEENGRPTVKGRPCGLLRVAADSFLLSDDLNGVIYFIHPIHS